MTSSDVVHDVLPPPPARVRIRQVALCVPDIWPVEQTVIAELGVAAVHRDPPNMFEMRNVVFAIGDTFLEVLQPTAASAPSARFLTRHGGPGGYMLILQVDDLEAARDRVEALGIRIVHDMPMAAAHGVRAGAIHLHPADTGGTLLSLDQMDPAPGWAWAGRAWEGHVHDGVVTAIAGVELTTADPDALVARLASLLGRAPDGHRIALDGGWIQVVAGPAGGGDHLSALELTAGPSGRPGRDLTLGGTTIRFR